MNRDELLLDEPSGGPKASLILGHGAGAAMDSPFMNFFAENLCERGIRVIRFEFPYMRKRRLEGTKSPPNPAKLLIQSWHEVLALCERDVPWFIGGKSMGGRIASMIADEVRPSGLICLGYPFHPPGNPTKLRTGHLADLKTPCLIVQGERDPFGTLKEVSQYNLSEAISFVWLPGGDHSFKPRKASGHTLEDHLLEASQQMAAFILKNIGAA